MTDNEIKMTKVGTQFFCLTTVPFAIHKFLFIQMVNGVTGGMSGNNTLSLPLNHTNKAVFEHSIVFL